MDYRNCKHCSISYGKWIIIGSCLWFIDVYSPITDQGRRIFFHGPPRYPNNRQQSTWWLSHQMGWNTPVEILDTVDWFQGYDDREKYIPEFYFRFVPVLVIPHTLHCREGR